MQAIKLSMDLVGRYGGPCRPPRVPLLPEQEARGPRGHREGRSPPELALTQVPTMRSTRVLHAVDSHTEGMPTRVITGGVGVHPRRDDGRAAAATSCEHRDDLRTLLMYEPRGHAAMSGAILQPPTRPDADCGVLYIEVSGCLPMCGHGTIGVATVLVETGMVEVVEPVTTIRLDTPAGLVVAEVAVRGRRRDGGDAAATCRRSRSRWTATVDGAGLRRRSRYDLAFGGNFYAILPIDDARPAVRPRAQAASILDAGLRSWSAINEQQRPVHPDEPRDRRLPPRAARSRPARTPATPATRWPSTPAGSTARPAAPAPAPGWRSCTPAASCPLDTDFVNESFIGTHVRRAAGRGDDGRPGRARGACPTITGRAWITGTAQYLLDPADPFPEGFEL